MIKFIKSLFGFDTPDTPVIAEPEKVAEPVKEPATKKKTTKKSATKKSGGTCNFDKLTKTQLLAEAKHRGIKANASLSKAELLERVKNG